MPDKSQISDAKRALLEKYLRGDIQKIAKVDTQHTKVGESNPRECVVGIRVEGSKRPFFFLHGDWISGAYWCFPLARALGVDQPFYALEPYNFDGLPVPPALETIAAVHLKSLRAIQPEGPYLLGGFCNGGLLAYEMARQLHVEGQKLDLLVLIDPMPMGPFYPTARRLARVMISSFGKLIRLREEQQIYTYIFLLHIYNYLRFSHYRKSEARSWQVEERTEFKCRRYNRTSILLRLRSIFPSIKVLRQHYSAIYDWTATRYTPSDFYTGKITFFWPSEEPANRRGWHKVVSNEREVHIIPGTQMGSRTDHLYDLAEHLSTCLSKIQEDS